MNNYSTRWSRYQIRRDIRRENPSILRLGRRMTEPAVRRQVARAVHDFKIAFARVQEGIRIWNNGEARTFGNYMIYKDAADATVDKMKYAEALLNHYAEVRTGHQDRDVQLTVTVTVAAVKSYLPLPEISKILPVKSR